eukprot:XP_001701976.1 hypothetical protein CHLREDRAFT_195545 [Chlamydomonas reinhardtii]
MLPSGSCFRLSFLMGCVASDTSVEEYVPPAPSRAAADLAGLA